MRTATDESAARLGSGGGGRNHNRRGKDTTRKALGASPRRDNRRGWRPVRIGELIDSALVGIGGER